MLTRRKPGQSVFSFALPDALVRTVDDHLADWGFSNRSDFARVAIAEAISARGAAPDADMAQPGGTGGSGAVEHDLRELREIMARLEARAERLRPLLNMPTPAQAPLNPAAGPNSATETPALAEQAFSASEKVLAEEDARVRKAVPGRRRDFPSRRHSRKAA